MGAVRDYRSRPEDESVGQVRRQICPTCDGLGWVPGGSGRGQSGQRPGRFSSAQQLARWLDLVGIPLNWGRPLVIRALREAGMGCRTQTIQDAINLRRWRAATGPEEPVRGHEEGGSTHARTPYTN